MATATSSRQDQAQVISRGMRWNPTMAQSAANGCYYIKVGEKGGQLQITGASNRWKKNPQDVYISSLRIAGPPDAVRSTLENNGYAPSQIDEFFSTAYTSSNFCLTGAEGGLKEQFDEECDSYSSYKKDNKTKDTDDKDTKVKLEYLAFLVDNLPNTETAKASRKTTTDGSKKGGARGAKVPLSDRISSLPAGKVLDVSNMKEGGAGVKTIDAPGAGSKKIYVDPIPVVSSSYERYCEAMTMLGTDYMPYCAKFQALQSAPPPAKVPKASAKGGSKPAVKAPVSFAAITAPKAPAPTVPAATKPVAPVATSKPAAPAPTASKSAPVAAPTASAPVKAPAVKAAPKVPKMPAVGSPRN